jgi:hypothetical protein
LVYDAMEERSEPQDVDGVEAMVYTGHLTKLFSVDLRLSVPYYTQVMNALKGMDCVRQIRRGGGSAPSVWLVVQPPTEDLFEGTRDPSTASKKVQQNEQILQQLRDLNRRVQVLEGLHREELEPVL